MPWKESSVMDERMRFVIRLKDGESMASLCREFGISRKTGYKMFERYEECGLEGLSDRTRRPFRYANQLPVQLEAVKVPATSTIHAVLDRHGLVRRPKRPRTRAEGTRLSEGLHPNDLWCTDYKGEFQLGDKRYCYPLTVTDHASRFLLLCEAMESNAEIPPLRPLSVSSRSAACHGPSVPTTACRSLPPMACSISPNSRLVAAPGHQHRTHSTRPPATERPP
jgi:hypothetical protein